MAKYCTRKAKGPFLPLIFERENWGYLTNLQPEGIICPFLKGKALNHFVEAEAFESTLAKAGLVLELFSHLSDPGILSGSLPMIVIKLPAQPATHTLFQELSVCARRDTRL